MKYATLQGDCLEVLKELDDNSMDSLITDPPAGISFMGKAWDNDKGGRKQWIAWMTEVMQECMRVMKPGAHGLVWAIPRTSHWTATALEDAGFEIRDVVTHLFGSGFPKSLDISKAIDKAAGLERERIPGGQGGNNSVLNARKPGEAISGEAKQWQGFGTALKPASEHWILVRKPCSEKTVAKNVEKWGCGGLNIDGSRIAGAFESGWSKSGSKESINASMSGKNYVREPKPDNPQGRFPANLVLSHSEHCTETQCDIECAIKMLDEQSGMSKSPSTYKRLANGMNKNSFNKGMGELAGKESLNFGDTGGASRFFKCISSFSDTGSVNGDDILSAIKAHDEHATLSTNDYTGFICEHSNDNNLDIHNTIISQCSNESNKINDAYVNENTRFFYCAKASKSDKGASNTHPTVKSSKLMSYLIKLITPPQGVVLDPFMGSGSTGVAAVREGFKFIGIEREQEYLDIANKRIENEDKSEDREIA